MRGPVSAVALGPAVVLLLAAALSQHDAACGRSSAARWSGTCSPSAPTFTVSLLFWYMGMIPDLATLRDRATTPLRQIDLRHAGDGLAQFGPALASLRDRPICCWAGWRRRWSSRCIRSSAPTSPFRIVPGWHETVFPPYFVAGAIFSGFAMVLRAVHSHSALLRPARISSRIDHLDVMGKILLATSLLTSYGYLSEQFMSWYGGETSSATCIWNRLIGFEPVCRRSTWCVFFCNTIAPQVLWFRRAAAQPGGAVDRVACSC